MGSMKNMDNLEGNDYVNRAKLHQLILFPMNNGATNVYYVLIMSFIAYYANGVIGLGLMFATTMVTIMRVFDAITDPIIGALIDRTCTRFGKFRPFMILGNGIMAISAILLFFAVRVISDDILWLKCTLYILFYALYVIGYTFQTACTRSGQTCLTSDPKQRPLFTIFNTIGSIIGMGLVQILAPIIADANGGYNTGGFFDIMVPLVIIISMMLTILAVMGIADKDRKEYFGVAYTTEKVKIREYIKIIKDNKEMQRLIVAGASTKLAFSIATNTTVLCMLYGAMMNDYTGLYIPMMAIGYICSAPFFILTVLTSRKHGQKKSLVRYTKVALIMYIGVTVVLCFWRQGVSEFNFSLMKDGNLSLNLYTIIFIIFFGLGYGSYYATADMTVPMVADCSDYETYRSGRYIPGIMGTIFSLVDKLISAASSTIVGLVVALIGHKTLPDCDTLYSVNMNIAVIFLFCIVPMMAWCITLFTMKKYSLSGKRMQEIQEVNVKRKKAIAEGMSLEEAMDTIQDNTFI